jgi:hypothetical protein
VPLESSPAPPSITDSATISASGVLVPRAAPAPSLPPVRAGQPPSPRLVVANAQPTSPARAALESGPAPR